MYTPAHFAESRSDVLQNFIRSYPLGALINCAAETGLTASHVPMLLDESGRTLLCHMARANPQWESLDGAQVLVIFTGAEHYISPSWYQSKEEHGKVVPTWNYTAVHVTGHSRVFEGESLYPHLRELTRENELGHGLGWNIADAPREWVDGLIKAIVGIEIAIERIEGKWKLSQNRPERDREGVIAGLDALGTPRGVAMSRAMKHRE